MSHSKNVRILRDIPFVTNNFGIPPYILYRPLLSIDTHFIFIYFLFNTMLTKILFCKPVDATFDITMADFWNVITQDDNLYIGNNNDNDNNGNFLIVSDNNGPDYIHNKDFVTHNLRLNPKHCSGPVTSKKKWFRLICSGIRFPTPRLARKALQLGLIFANVSIKKKKILLPVMIARRAGHWPQSYTLMT